MSKVIIGCKLPHGITLHGTAGQEIKLNGMNTALVAGGFGLTNVDADEAAYLFAQYEDFAPFKSNAIFTNSTAKVADLAAIGRELASEKTGFEGMDPAAPVAGIKPEDEGQLGKALDAAESQPRPARAPKAAADKAAANELAGA